MSKNRSTEASTTTALQDTLSDTLTTCTVVKRNGALVPFRRDRIYHAIESAFRDVKKIDKEFPLPAEIKDTVEEMTKLVVEQALTAASRGTCLTVEGIQDIVEVTLMKEGHHDVARGYIIYRDQHKALREDSPQNFKVKRRDGSIVTFNPIKIAAALEKTFRRTQHSEGPSAPNIIDAVNLLTQNVVARAGTIVKAGHELSTNILQDEIEQQLMREGFYPVAKEYILYRASLGEQTPALAELPPVSEQEKGSTFTITLRDGSTGKVTEKALRSRIKFACRGLEELVSVEELTGATVANFYEGIKEGEIDQASIMAARAKIELEPAYSRVASRLLLDILYRESVQVTASDPSLESRHRTYFKTYLKYAVQIQRIHPDLLKFDLDMLAKAMQLQGDDLFGYLGLQTLYDRYFIHDHSRRLETPQIFWMRVAMGLASMEGKEKNQRAIEFYDLLSRFYYISSTPTLFNAGTLHPQLSSCYLSTVMDDLSHIFKVISDDAQLSKWAGGIGNDWSNVRATGSLIKGTNGKSQGVIPFLKVANDTAVAVNQCFAPETALFTSKGTKPISDVQIGDLVLGISGTYRQVTDKFTYNQKDPMVSIDVKHSIHPLTVTAGHPFYAIRGVPLEQSTARTLRWLKKRKVKCEWIDADQLQKGDYIAQSIPKEIIRVPEIDLDGAHLYGILLGDGHLSKEGRQWGVSGNPKSDSHLQFIRRYLEKRGIHYWETARGDAYVQIHWAAGRGAVRDGTTGRIIGSGEATLPFDHSDIYDNQGRKHIAPRLAHMPRPETLAMIQGLLETDGNVSRKKEITFTNTSEPLVQGLRYQMLRLGVPTAGNFRVRKNGHTGRRSDGSLVHFDKETKCYDLRIPAIPELAARLQCTPLTKFNWLEFDNHIFTRVKKKRERLRRTSCLRSRSRRR